MKLKLILLSTIFLLALGLTTAYPDYQDPTIQGTPGSGLLYSNGRVSLYQNPQAFTGSGVYQARTGKHGPAYSPFPMPNTPASGRKGEYSSYIFLDNQLAVEFYTHPELLQPRYMTNNIRYLKGLAPRTDRTTSWWGVQADLDAKRYDTLGPYSAGILGPFRDKRAPLIHVSGSDRARFSGQMGFLI